MKKVLSLTFRVLLIVLTPGLLTTTNAWAQMAPKFPVQTVQPETVPVAPVVDTKIAANTDANQIVPAGQEVQAPPRKRQVARYSAYDPKLAKKLSKQVPSLRGVTLGFDGPVDNNIRRAFALKYGLLVQENCKALPVICVWVRRVSPLGYVYGSGYGTDSGYSSRGGSNGSRNSGYSVGASTSYNDSMLKIEIEVTLLTEDFEPQPLGFVSNLAFAGTTYSGSNLYIADGRSSFSGGNYRSSSYYSGDSSYGSSTVSENQALRSSADKGIQVLFGTAGCLNKLDRRIHPAWMYYANEAIDRAFGANR